MNILQIKFTIQSLDGETFPISILRRAAQKIYNKSTMKYFSHDPIYKQYGLDVLKDAICVYKGTDPCIQQLVCGEELTLSTPLIPLENKVITLILKPSFRIEFANPTSDLAPHQYAIDAINSYLAGSRIYKYTICLLNNKTQIPQIEVLGMYRNYFKIASEHLPSQYLTSWAYGNKVPYIICPDTPKYVWLRDEQSIKMV
jgi:hypothetical protein